MNAPANINADAMRQTKARKIIADLLSSSVLQNMPEFAFIQDGDNPLMELQEKLHSIEGALQEHPDIFAFMEEFTKTYTRALKSDQNRHSADIKQLQENLGHLSDYLLHIRQEIKNPKDIKIPDEYEIIIDALRNQAAIGYLGPLSNVARQIRHWAEHTAEELKKGVGIDKPLKSKLWRIPTACGLVGGVLAATIMMYANYQPPTTIKMSPVSTAYITPTFNEDGLLSPESAFAPDARIESMKIGCHSHIKAATFNNQKLADFATSHIFKDEQAYQDCIVIGETSRNYYERFDMPAYTARDTIASVLPDRPIKSAFTNGVNYAHDFWKGANNVENAVVHPLITQFHLATGTKIAFGSLMLLWTIAGLRDRDGTYNNKPSLRSMTFGHINANRLRYGFMGVAAGTVIHEMDASFAGIVLNIPNLISYSVGGLLAGDTAQWAWAKIKKKDFIEAVPFAEVKANLQAFSDVEPLTLPPSWKTFINTKNVAYGTGAFALADAAFFGGQGTALTLGAAVSTAIDLPYLVIEDIPIHIPFAVLGESVGIAVGGAAGLGAGAYLLGKKLGGKPKQSEFELDGPA